MAKIRTIQVRLSRQQYDRILNDSLAKGFNTLSAYLRYLALYRDQATLKKILEIHDAVVPRRSRTKHATDGFSDETHKQAL